MPLIIDGGPCLVGVESTVLDLSGDVPTILRPGQITTDQIADVLGAPIALASGVVTPGTIAKSPGQMTLHYAPTTPTYRVDRDQLPSQPPPGRFALLVLGPLPPPMAEFGSPWTYQVKHLILDQPHSAARDLYARLHELDAEGHDLIVIVPPPNEPAWHGVLDRITRASQPWTV